MVTQEVFPEKHWYCCTRGLDHTQASRGFLVNFILIFQLFFICVINFWRPVFICLCYFLLKRNLVPNILLNTFALPSSCNFCKISRKMFLQFKLLINVWALLFSVEFGGMRVWYIIKGRAKPVPGLPEMLLHEKDRSNYISSLTSVSHLY